MWDKTLTNCTLASALAYAHVRSFLLSVHHLFSSAFKQNTSQIISVQCPIRLQTKFRQSQSEVLHSTGWRQLEELLRLFGIFRIANIDQYDLSIAQNHQNWLPQDDLVTFVKYFIRTEKPQNSFARNRFTICNSHACARSCNVLSERTKCRCPSLASFRTLRNVKELEKVTTEAYEAVRKEFGSKPDWKVCMQENLNIL